MGRVVYSDLNVVRIRVAASATCAPVPVRRSFCCARTVPTAAAMALDRPFKLMLPTRGQGELEGRAGTSVRRDPQVAAMRLADRTADRQTHAHAFGLGSEKGVEESRHTLRAEPDTEVLHRHEHCVRCGPLRADP